jgi:predicted membrane protein
MSAAAGTPQQSRIKQALPALSLLLAVLCCVCPWINVLAPLVNAYTLLLLLWVISLYVCFSIGGEHRKWALLGVPVALFPLGLTMFGCAFLGAACP